MSSAITANLSDNGAFSAQSPSQPRNGRYSRIAYIGSGSVEKAGLVGLATLISIAATLIYREFGTAAAVAAAASLAVYCISVLHIAHRHTTANRAAIKPSIPVLASRLNELVFRRTHNQRGLGLAPTMTMLDISIYSMAIGEHESWIGTPARTEFRPCLQLVVNEVTQYLPNDSSSILEIGSGRLDSNNRSYLSSLLPRELSARVIYSDLSSSVGKHHAVTHISACNLTRVIQPASVGAVIALCAFDCIQHTSLDRTFSEVATVLRPEGRVVAISDLPPFNSAVTDAVAKNGRIIFPWTGANGENLGLQSILPADLIRFCNDRDSRLEPGEKQYLLKLAQLDPGITEPLTNEHTAKGTPESVAYSKWIEGLKIPGMLKQSALEISHTALLSAIRRAGLIVESAFKKVTKAVHSSRRSSDAPDINQRTMTVHGIYSDWNDDLSSSTVLRSLEAYVMVAQKPAS